MYNHIALFIGHLVGDYFLQNDWMATKKSEKTRKGMVACDVHCFLYSCSVTAAVVLGGWRVTVVPELQFMLSIVVAMLIAYITHYPIDRVGLAGKWMQFYGSTLFKVKDGHCSASMCEDGQKSGMLDVTINKRQYFVAPVYIVVDNTMHIVLMWILFSVCGEIVA